MSCSPVLDDRWFRGVIYGVVVADLWGVEAGVGEADPLEEEGWRSQFLEIVAAEAMGQAAPKYLGREVFVRMARRSQPGLLLLALPVLLMQANPYGHRSYPWQAWTAGLGLLAEDLVVMDQAFQMVCRAMAGRPPGLWSGQDRALTLIQGLLKTSQGEFSLAIRLARRQGGDPLLVSWLGAVTLIQGGWAALPSTLRHGCLESGILRQRWGDLDEAGLNQLALNLYDRWRGRRPGPFPQDGFSV